jgi:hypothetical protein
MIGNVHNKGNRYILSFPGFEVTDPGKILIKEMCGE